MKHTTLLFCALSLASAAAATAPYKGVFSNDTTNLLTCVSPYHKKGGKLVTEDMIRESVAEAVVPNIEAQILQPGMGNVPWWPSKVAPLDEQERWFEKHYGIKPSNEYHDFLRKGGDLVGVFLDECKKQGVAGIISLRLNDAHHLEYAWGENGIQPQPWMVQSISKFYVEHPDWVLPPRPGAGGMKGRGMNWLFEGPRVYKLSLIAELIENYDLDALELDFMRFPYYFPDGTPMAERLDIMADFIKKTRALLDKRFLKDGKKRWLFARVPAFKREWERVAFDPAVFHAAGVEVFNASPNYCTTQQTDIAAIRAAAPGAVIYYEQTHTVQVRHTIKGYDGFIFRRNTQEMIETTARIAYERGADGLSAFNFVYYREHGPSPEARGPFNEPPFEYLGQATDKAAIMKSEPSYFYYAVNDSRDVIVNPKRLQRYRMDIVPPSDSKERTPILRLMVLTQPEFSAPEGTPVAKNADRGQWKVIFNEKILSPLRITGRAYPFGTPIKAGFGQKEQYLAFAVPPELIANGENEISVKLLDETKEPLSIRFIELYYPE